MSWVVTPNVPIVSVLSLSPSSEGLVELASCVCGLGCFEASTYVHDVLSIHHLYGQVVPPGMEGFVSPALEVDGGGAAERLFWYWEVTGHVEEWAVVTVVYSIVELEVGEVVGVERIVPISAVILNIVGSITLCALNCSTRRHNSSCLKERPELFWSGIEFEMILGLAIEIEVESIAVGGIWHPEARDTALQVLTTVGINTYADERRETTHHISSAVGLSVGERGCLCYRTAAHNAEAVNRGSLLVGSSPRERSCR